ncbi:MAG: hypothetical protein JW938_01680 [Candidatus Omnitrophica bacterium]|nr:hypothetical protein [Candidatus Omnitrophota bacterium]
MNEHDARHRALYVRNDHFGDHDQYITVRIEDIDCFNNEAFSFDRLEEVILCARNNTSVSLNDRYDLLAARNPAQRVYTVNDNT